MNHICLTNNQLKLLSEVLDILLDFTDPVKKTQINHHLKLMEIFERPNLFKKEMNLNEKYDDINEYINSFEETLCKYCKCQNEYSDFTILYESSEIKKYYTARDGCIDCYLKYI